MSEAKKERYEYVAVQTDQRLREAIEKPGVTGYQRLLLGLAGTQELDEPTKKGLFWQLIGWLGADAGRRAARPWQLLSFVLLFTLFLVVAYTWNLLVLMAIGAIP